MDNITDRNYYQVQGWMITQLHLKGLEKDIYAIIYGFSQDGASKFYGSRKYLAEWTNSTERSVQTAINNLVENGLIIANKRSGTTTEYSINLSALSDSKQDLLIDVEGRKNFTGGVKNFHRGCEKTSHDNNIYNKLNNNNKKENKKKENKFSVCADVVETLVSDQDIKDSLYKYLKYRITVGLTKDQWVEIVSSLDTLANTKEDKLEIIDIAYQSSYKKFYPLKSYRKDNKFKDDIPILSSEEDILRQKYREEFRAYRLSDKPSFEEWRKTQ